MTGAVPCHEPEANEARSQPTPHRSNQSDNAAPCGYAALGWSASTWRLQIGLNNLPGTTSTPATQPLSKRPLRASSWRSSNAVWSPNSTSAALRRNANVGGVGGHGRVSRLAVRGPLSGPGLRLGRGRPLPPGVVGPAGAAAKATNAGARPQEGGPACEIAACCRLAA